jgi:hypothetical protein
MYSYKKSKEIFETYNTFLQSPFWFQLRIFFTCKVPEVFLPIEKNILIQGLNSFRYHLSKNFPYEKSNINSNIEDMISLINSSFVPEEEFINSLFVKDIREKNLEILVSNLEYLKEYQKKFIIALEKEHFLKEPFCSVKVLNSSEIDM